MDYAQVTLFIVIVILAILLVALGVQVFFILREFKKTVSKANKVLDDAGVITHSVSAPMSSFSGIAAGIKTVIPVVSLIKKIFSKDKDKKKEEKKEEKDGE